jgi:cell division protein FtsZ
METSINGAHGVLINITGSSDMGLEDVEAAADLVQEAAHPDANIIFGASFDETLQDEIRVTVIATGFEEGAAQAAAAEKAAMARKTAAVEAPVQEPAAPAASAAPSVPPVFKKAAPAMAPVVPSAAPAADAAPAGSEDEPAEDPFDNIFKIFNTK